MRQLTPYFLNLSRLLGTAADNRLGAFAMGAGFADGAFRPVLNEPPPAFLPCPVTAADPPVLRPVTPAVRDEASPFAHLAQC